MKLVGAKGSFIRRPFLNINALQGVIAGVLSAGVLCALVGWIHNWDAALIPLLPWPTVLPVCGGLVILGVIICVLAAAVATNRYLRKDYDEMFR